MFKFLKRKKKTETADALKSLPTPVLKASLRSLEQRLMFDGAAAATAAEVASETVAQEQAEEAVTAESTQDSTASEPTDDQSLLQALSSFMPNESRTEIVFVDPTVPNYQELLSGLDANAEVVLLDVTRDGVEQIAETLAGRTGIDAIHLISHGDAGTLQLGTGTLTTESMTGQYADELVTIQQALSDQADILVYGCDFAEGDAGQDAVTLLSQLTGADVAASTDATGAATLGGDWTLETQTGAIETHIAVTDALQMDWVGLLDISTGLIGNWTFDTNANDSSGNSYDGTLTNGAAIDTTDATDIVGGAKLSLDGVNDYVDLSAHSADLAGFTQGTIAGWIKTTSTFETIFSISDTADTGSSVALFLGASGYLTYEVRENGVLQLAVYRSSATINDGNWHHVAVTVGASGNSLYVDGVLATAGQLTYDAGDATTQGFFSSVTSLDSMAIGRNQGSGGGTWYTTGLIDDVRVYDRVLTGGDIAQLYTTSNDAPTLTNLSGDSLSYSEGAGAVVIEQGANVLVADIDSSNFDTGTLTISIPSGGDSAEDVLSIRNQGAGAGQIGVSGSNVTYGGVTIGTFTGGSNGSNLVITLNSSADATAVTALIKNITYENTDAAAPTTGARTVRYVLTDGDGATSANYDTTVTVTAVNDAPVLALGATNLLTNGSFESGATGWTGNTGVEATTRPWDYGIPAPPDGTGFLEVEAGNAPAGTGSYVEQTFTTVVGQTYMVSLSAITRMDVNVQDRGALSINGVEIGQFTTGTSWQDYAISFTATSTSSTLQIISKGSLSGGAPLAGDAGGLLIDHVQVVAVQTVATYTEGGAPVVLAGTARVLDAELSALNNFNGATLTLTRNGGANAEDIFSGSGTLSLTSGNVVVSGTTIGTYSNSGGTLQLTFNANATNTLVNSAMQQIAYSNSSDAPPASAQINWTFSDGNSGGQGSGGALTATGSTTVTIAGVNDAPTITNLSGDSLSYNEGAGALVIEQGGNALVADIDSSNFDTGTLTISIPSGGDSAEDVLSIRNQGTGAGQIGVSGSSVTYGGVTIGTFTGGSNGSNLVITLNSSASPTAVTALIKNITYENTDVAAPTTGSRTVRYVLTDGDGGTSANYDTTVTVSGTNDAPVLTDSGLTFTVLEDAGAPVNGTAVGVPLSTFTGNITDPDGAVAKGIAIVGSTETNGTWYYTTDAGATWHTVGAVSDTASLLLADTAGTRLYFAPNSNYTGNVFPGLIVRAWDQSGGVVGTKVDTTVQGGSTAFSVQGDTIDPTVIAVNDPPAFSNLDGTPTFTEGGAAVVLDSNVTFMDPELSALNGGAGDYFGSSILLERNGGPNANDVFSATGNLSPLIEGTSLVLSGVTIGYVTTNSGGTLLITFDHNATSARVNEAVQSIAYSNTSEAPSSPVVINWASGDGNDGSQGTGGVLGATGSTTVTIAGVNDAPTITNLSGDSVSYSEGAGPVVIEQGGNALVADIDSSNFDTGTLTISIPSGGDSAEDVLSIRNQGTGAGQIGVSGSNVTYGGVTIGTFTGGSNGSNLVITLNSSATPTAVTALIKNITYENTDTATPTTGARTVRYVLTDGDGGISANYDTTVTVSGVNDAPTFGVGDGQATTSFGSGWEFGKETILQPDGKILVAGYSDSGGSDDFSLTRYNADGTLDTSFGGGDGIALAGIVGRAETAVLQPDGKIVLSGYTTNGGYQVCLVRFNVDGTLDTSFGGGDGIASSGVSGSAKDVALQADGKFLVAADLSNSNFNLMRFNSDGSLDTSFGGGSGYVSTDLSGGNDRADSLTIQSDGKVILAGFGFNGTSFDFALVRYNTDGSLDTSFNGTGKVLTDFGGDSSDTGNEVRVQADGKIVVAGWSDTGGTNDFAIARYSTNGTVDAGFGTGGKVTINLGGSDLAEGLTIQADGKLLVTGTAGINGNDFGLVRLNTDGSLDTTFSGDGIVTTDYTASSDDRAYSVTVQNDGQIVVSGTSKVGALGDYNYALTRYSSTGALDTTLDPVNTLDGAPTFTEGGSPVVLDGDVQIFDAELSALNNFNGATLTLARNGGANAEDVFSSSGTLSLSSGNVMVSGTTIGTYSNSGGTLQFTFNASATSTLVNSAMRQIAYSNSSDGPPASVQINWTFSDGNSGGQGSGGALTATGSTTVTITAVNDAPVITPIAPDVTFVEGGLPQVVDATGTIVDVDSANFDGGVMTVSISTNGTADDRLQVGNFGAAPGQVGLSGSNVTYGGTVIGTVSGGTSGSDPLVITFNASAPPMAVQEVYRSIQFTNVSENPSTATRTLTIGLTDGDGGTATPQNKLVYVQSANDVPVLTFGEGDKNFTEGALAVMIDALPNVSDLDSTNFDTGALTITISANPSVDDRVELLNTGMGAGQIGVSGTNVYYGGTLIGTQAGGIGAVPFVVTFNANADASIVGAVMANIRFWVAGDAPSTATRTVEAALTDGDGGTSITASKQITVTAVNDAPTDLALSANTVAENAANGTVVGTVSGTDPDTGDTKTYSFTDSAGGRFAINSSTGQITVADGSLLNYEAALSHTVTVRVTDSGGLTYDEAFTINLTNVNDAPTGADATVTITEDISHTLTTANFGFSDADAGDSLSAVRIDSLPGAGSLTLSGVAVTAGQVVSVADITAGNLVFTPAADANGTGYANITFSVRDSTSAYDTAPNTLIFDVTPVDDAPINSVPGAQVIAEDTPLALSGISVTDVDGNLSTVQLAVGNGTLNVTLSGSATISSGSNGTNTLTLSGSQADINATLASLSYQGTADFTGSDTLTVTSTDSNAGSDVDTVAITVTAVNDAPVLDLDADNSSGASGADYQATFAEGGGPVSLVDSMDALLSDVDSGNLTGLTVTLSNQLDGTSEVLSADTTGTAIVAVYDSGTGVLTLSGSDTCAHYQQVLRTIQYNNTSNSPDLTSRILYIVAEDGVTYSNTSTVTVTMTAANDAPTDLALSANTVAENAANGTIVGTVSGTDPDSGDTKTYSLTDTAGGRFAIDSTTGQITVADGGLLDYEAATGHTVTVRVTDSGGLTYDEAFTINLTNVNDAPTAIVLSGSAVAENAVNGTAVGTASAVDADAGDSHTYQLLANAGGRFAIDPATGVISVADGTLLDFETATSHTITVRVIDAGGLTHDQTVTIAVADVNETGLVTTTMPGSLLPGPQPPPVVSTLPPATGEPSSTGPADGMLPPSGSSSSVSPSGSSHSSIPRSIPHAGAALLQAVAPGRVPEGEKPVVHEAERGTVAWTLVEPVLNLLHESADYLRHLAQSPEIPVRLSEMIVRELDEMTDFLDHAMEGRQDEETLTTVTAASVSVVLSAGYLVWALRGGWLMASLLATMPAWHSFDPLPVLVRSKEDRKADASADDSQGRTEQQRPEDEPVDAVFDPQKRHAA